MNDGPRVLVVISGVSVHVDRNLAVLFFFLLAEGTSITCVQVLYKFHSFP